MSPRADFVCLSRKCEPPEGQEPELFEAAVTATRCPVCGSKRIKRLFNKVGVLGTRRVQAEPDWRLTSSSPLQRSKAMLQDGADAAYKRRASAHAMPTYEVSGTEHEVSTAQGKFIMPSRSEVVQHFNLGGKGEPMKQLDIAREIRRDPLSVPAVLNRLNRRDIPTVSFRDPR